MTSWKIAAAAAVIAAGMAAGSIAQAQPAPQGPPAPPPRALKEAPVKIGTAIVQPDVTYSTLPGFRPLKLDLYRPAQAKGLSPIVLYLHGGGWAVGDPRSGPFGASDGTKSFAELAGRGYVVAGVAYRFVGEARYPAQIQDVRAAIRFLKAHAAEYGADPNHVAIIGASAGSYLAAVAASSCGDASLDPRPGPARPGAPPPAAPAAGSECVNAVVAFYPPVDFPTLSKGPAGEGPITPFLGCPVSSCPPQQLAAAAVLSRIKASTPPFLILHGDADNTVPIAQSQMLNAALKGAGVSSELIVVPGQPHGFPTLSAADEHKLWDRILAFLDTNLKK